MRTGCWALVIGMLLVLAPSTSRADARSDARVLVQEGARLYEKGDFAGALSHFDQAYAKFPTAIIHFNRGQALRSLGRPAEAIDAVERFLKEAIDAPVERLRDAQQMLQELQSQVASMNVASNVGGAEVWVDSTRVGTTPLHKPIVVKPGSHRIVVQKFGMTTFTRTVDLAPGGRLNVEAQLTPSASVVAATVAPAATAAPSPSASATISTQASPTPAGESGGTQRTLGFVIAAAGIAGLAVGGIYGWLTYSRNHDAEGICPGTAVCPAGTDPAKVTHHGELVADAKSYRTISIVGFVAGGAALVTGGILLLTAPSGASRSAVRVVPIGGVGLAGLAIQGAW